MTLPTSDMQTTGALTVQMYEQMAAVPAVKWINVLAKLPSVKPRDNLGALWGYNVTYAVMEGVHYFGIQANDDDHRLLVAYFPDVNKTVLNYSGAGLPSKRGGDALIAFTAIVNNCLNEMVLECEDPAVNVDILL